MSGLCQTYGIYIVLSANNMAVHIPILAHFLFSNKYIIMCLNALNIQFKPYPSVQRVLKCEKVDFCIFVPNFSQKHEH